MNNQALPSDYAFDEGRHIWVRTGYTGISYSDGDEVENRIAEIINNAHDLSTLSAELAKHCKDWPTLYHLSRMRANLLRPFETHLRGKRVLEIGAGCGALTRYLGEIDAEVVALEGSLRRASIAASRCRNLDHVVVVAEALHHLRPVHLFDVVTLIGVLEYARKFFPTQSGDPVDVMLSTAKSFLKPGGKLLIAIENQLGLKYFAGFPEDHIGKPMFGVEGHYAEDGVVTFGRKDLGKRVNQAGLGIQQWWYPFPDYKLPSLMISEAGSIPQDDIDLTSVVRNACIADPQYPPSISFRQERTWPFVINNGLLSEMANSFTLLASDTAFAQQQDLPLAVHYSTDRRPEFAKKVVFKRTCHGTVVAHQIALCPSTKPSGDSVLRQQLVDQPFVRGELWQDRLLQIMTSPDWTLERIQEWITVWFNAFCIFADIRDLDNIADKTVPGKYLDAIPRNMVLDKNGAVAFIDQEWIFFEDLNVGYLAFRALLTSLSPIKVVAKPLEDKNLRVLQLLISVMRHINVDVNDRKIKEYFDLEVKLDQLAGGKQTYNKEELALGFMSLELSVFDTQTPVHEKLAAYDARLTYVSQALAERDRQLNDILNSSSWRVTRPLRTLRKWCKSGSSH